MKMLYPKQSVYHHWLLVYQSNAERKVMEDSGFTILTV